VDFSTGSHKKVSRPAKNDKISFFLLETVGTAVVCMS